MAEQNPGSPYIRTGKDEKNVYAIAVDRLARKTENGGVIQFSTVAQKRPDLKTKATIRRNKKVYLCTEEEAAKFHDAVIAAMVDGEVNAVVSTTGVNASRDEDDPKLIYIKLSGRGNNVSITEEEAKALIERIQSAIDSDASEKDTENEEGLAVAEVKRLATPDENGNIVFVTLHANKRSRVIPFTEEYKNKYDEIVRPMDLFVKQVESVIHEKMVTLGEKDALSVLDD